MNIVIVDGHTANPGDLDWKPLESLGKLTVYPRTDSSQLIERAIDAEVILTNKVKIDALTLNKLPKLRYIGVLATGYDHIDINACKSKRVSVTNVPSYSTFSVAQHVFALLLNYINEVARLNASVKQGQWSEASDFCYWLKPITSLNGLRLGIIGYGEIGQKVADIALSFGMKVLVYNPSVKQDSRVTFVSLENLFSLSDIISLHCPLKDNTLHFINEKSLSLMKKTAVLINTARGALVDEKALAYALKQRKIAFALLDVLEKEPPIANHLLVDSPFCHITPHVAWASLDARARLIDMAAQNLAAFLKNSHKNIVG